MTKSKTELCHDVIAERYDSDLDKEPYMRLYEDITWDNIKRYIPKNKKALVLDAGGGTGRWAVRLARLGYNIVLVDISEGMLKVAERKIKKLKLASKIKISRVDIRDMRIFHDKMFDFVICQGDPLSYCSDYNKALKELVRVLNKTGCLIASVDNRIINVSRLVREKRFKEINRFLSTGNLFVEDPRSKIAFPIHAFTQDELKNLFVRNGLRVLRVIGNPPIPTNWAEKLLKDEKAYKEILRLCIKLADKPEFMVFAGHLEIVGLKC